MAGPPSESTSRPGGPLVPLADPGPPVWILYVDLDAYYVACELKERPELRGRPVIVGRPPTDAPTRGVVLSASYEARRFGVRSAMPVVTAARLCPDAVWISPDFPKYAENARRVRAILDRFSPKVVPYSIDEAAVYASVPTADRARAMAVAIQTALRTELDLPASLGVATTRTVAKIATDRAKPAGILVVPPEEVAAFLAPLPVRAIPGVGPKTDELLRAAGIVSIGDLTARPPRELEQRFGGLARELVAIARGNPHESPDEYAGPRSRSTDRTFDTDVTSWEEIEPSVRALAEDLAVALDREGLRYATVGVGLRWGDLARTQRRRTLSAAHEDAAPMVEEAVRLARELWDVERSGRARSVRTVSVRAEQLERRTQRQRSLDDAWEGRARTPR
jgi:nucleotidyltransferase/DNA polymerase involved in DNA repair